MTRADDAGGGNDGMGVDGWAGSADRAGADGAGGANDRTGTEGATGGDGRMGVGGWVWSPDRAGIDGAGGAKGRTGTDGATGVDGWAGSPDRAGADDVGGARGRTGIEGATGVDGRTGSPDRPGADDVGGAKGPARTDGATGTGELSRADGWVGTTGASGVDGRVRADDRDGTGDAIGVDHVTWADGRVRTDGRDAADDATGVDDRTGNHDVGDDLLARVFLARVVEPGDEVAGRWIRELGAVEVARRLGNGGPQLTGVTDKRWAGLCARAGLVEPGRDLAVAQDAGVRFVCPGDVEWPGQLDDLGDARPIGLWVRGHPNLRVLALKSVAIVGARACTEYGAHMAATLAAGLAERGWVVVSGGAYGVDGAAHRGALGATDVTVAVLACGVDQPYPRGHAELIRRIAEQGLVVGELPPGEHPTPSRFILRNRVIAALTRGTVVVEAAYRSGSLVTARAAQRLGRHTIGVPGPATSALSAGVHELLRGGAVLVTDVAEIVELVGGMGELAPDRRGPVLPRDLLEPAARRILAALPGNRAALPREIARGAQTTEDDAIARLYELRALGYVERHGDGWKLTRQAMISVRPDRGRR